MKYTYQFFGWGSDSHDSTFIKGAESPENKNTELNQNQDLRKHRHKEHSFRGLIDKTFSPSVIAHKYVCLCRDDNATRPKNYKYMQCPQVQHVYDSLAHVISFLFFPICVEILYQK